MTKTKKPTGLQNISIILLLLTALLTVTVGLVSCSSKTDEYTDTDTERYNDKIKRDERTGPARTQNERSRDDSNTRQRVPKKKLIKKIYYSSRAGDADNAMKVNVETNEPLQENHHFSFIHWKNGNEIEDTNEDTIPASALKKGDFIFSDVLLYQDEQLIEKKRTRTVQILNSRPVIKNVIFPDVKGPGTYTLDVKAEDPDGDQLTFSLEKEELPVDIQVDPSTGVVTCTLNKDTPKTLKFTIVVDDGNGGVTKKVLTMRFFKQSLNKDEA